MELEFNPVLLLEETLSDEFGFVLEEFRKSSDEFRCFGFRSSGQPA